MKTDAADSSLGADSGGSTAAIDPVHACGRAAAGTVTSRFDVGYYDPDGDGPWPTLLANVWLPDPVQFPGKRPGLLMVHGGCGTPAGGDAGGGCRSTYGTPAVPQDGDYLAGRGYVAVAIQYRYPQNQFAAGGGTTAEADLAKVPAALQDLRCALRWMRSTSTAGLGVIDRDRIAIYGGSGGGYFALDVVAQGNRGLDLSYFDNPACPFNSAEPLGDGSDSASVQAAVTGFPRADDRPPYLDFTKPGAPGPVRWPPVDPDDWLTAAGTPARGNYWTASLMTTLDHFFGGTNFPSLYGADAAVTAAVDAMTVIPKVRADWPPIFITHSVWDDLNYYQGTRDLEKALHDVGYPDEHLTVVPVSEATCDPPGGQGEGLYRTIFCDGHDFALWMANPGDDPADGADLNGDGEPDYDTLTSMCTLKRFLEVRLPAGRPVAPPADFD